MSVFRGSAVALVTPFTNDGINFEALDQLVEFQIENGTDAIVACGTTGEPSTMKQSEREQVIRRVVDRVGRRIPVIAGTGGNNTAECVEHSLAAKEVGANALLVVTPYYNKTTQDGLIKHYEVITDAVQMPVIIYNVPARTGLNMTSKTLAALCENPYIVGMKEASADIKQIIEMARLTRGKLSLYSGDDDHVVPVLSTGGDGVISVVANVVPRMMRDLVAKWHLGDAKGSLEIQFQINPLAAALFSEVNPIPVKTALRMMGFDVGPLRLPLVDMSEANAAVLNWEMDKLGLLGGRHA